MGFCYLPPERVKVRLMLFTPLQSQTSSEQQEGNKQQGQNGQRVKTSVIYPLSQTNSEQQERKPAGSKWAKGQDELLFFTP